MAGNFLVMDPAWITMFSDAMDDMLVAWGKQCKLIFPSIQTECVNCVWDSMTRRSMNIYRTGGPIPFGQGNLCSVCGGKGVSFKPEYTENITMILRWNPANFIIKPGNISVPNGFVETDGLISDLPKILQSRVMIAEIPFEPIVRARFILSGEPIDAYSIVQGKCFTALWERKG